MAKNHKTESRTYLAFNACLPCAVPVLIPGTTLPLQNSEVSPWHYSAWAMQSWLLASNLFGQESHVEPQAFWEWLGSNPIKKNQTVYLYFYISVEVYDLKRTKSKALLPPPANCQNKTKWNYNSLDAGNRKFRIPNYYSWYEYIRN